MILESFLQIKLFFTNRADVLRWILFTGPETRLTRRVAGLFLHYWRNVIFIRQYMALRREPRWSGFLSCAWAPCRFPLSGRAFGVNQLRFAHRWSPLLLSQCGSFFDRHPRYFHRLARFRRPIKCPDSSHVRE